jgi:hypothetical protein
VLAPVVEPEELVRVAMLLVVVDQPRVRGRGDDRVEAPVPVEFARVAVRDERLASACASTTGITSACWYSSTSPRQASSSPAARGANHCPT